MIERIWVKNFRMLRSNRVDLSNFAILVGKNATGKTTLLAAIEFVSNLVRFGVEDAIRFALGGSRGEFKDLCFAGDAPLEFALDLRLQTGRYRYEVAIGETEFGPLVVREKLSIRHGFSPQPSSDTFAAMPESDGKVLVRKTDDGLDWFDGNGQVFQFRIGRKFTSLGHVPQDPVLFAGANAALRFFTDGIRLVSLESSKLRAPSPAWSPKVLSSDGSSLASAARALRERDLPAFRQWVDHVAGAVEGLEEIDIWDRPEDRASVLRAKFQGRADWVPSNFLSDGTLRLLALSLLAYAEKPDDAGIVLVEEPENGLHPLAMQYVFDALAGMEHTQVFVATHSPIFLAQATLDDALCFSRNPDGSASIVRGSDLAKAKGWDDAVRLETLFAAGVVS